MRAAVGDQKMTYAGFSYGTELGTAYAEAFPQNVRALLLDGAIDPTQSTIDSTVKQNAGFQLAFDNFAKDCTSRPGCPLGTDPAKATQAFQTIMRPLIDRPARVGDGRILSFSDAQTGVSQALYVSQLWPALQQGISQVANGNGDLLIRLADLYYERDEQGRYSNMLQAFQAISCVNQPAITEPSEALELAKRADEAAPFRSTGRARSAPATRVRSGRSRPPASRTRRRSTGSAGRRGVGHRRPGHAVPGRGRPGAAAERQPDQGQRQPAHGIAAG